MAAAERGELLASTSKAEREAREYRCDALGNFLAAIVLTEYAQIAGQGVLVGYSGARVGWAGHKCAVRF